MGYYAIELYSGRLTLIDAERTADATPDSRGDLQQAAESAVLTSEPLRIVVLGRANAGKSSLINALFGQLTAATDALPDTTAELKPYRLEREGLDAALIFDSPGCDTALLNDKTLKKAVLDADLLLWVCAAHRPDRRLAASFELDQSAGRGAEAAARTLAHLDPHRPADADAGGRPLHAHEAGPVFGAGARAADIGRDRLHALLRPAP